MFNHLSIETIKNKHWSMYKSQFIIAKTLTTSKFYCMWLCDTLYIHTLLHLIHICRMTTHICNLMINYMRKQVSKILCNSEQPKLHFINLYFFLIMKYNLHYVQWLLNHVSILRNANSTWYTCIHHVHSFIKADLFPIQ